MPPLKNIHPNLWLLVLSLLAFPVAQVQANIDAGPYIQNVTKTSVQLLYEGDDTDGTGLVDYGDTPSYGNSVTALKRGLFSYEEFYLADITGLAPNTLHYYRLTHEGEVRSGTFVTAPDTPDQPFTFAIVGDTRSNHAAHEKVVDAMVFNEGYPDLFFNSGDLVADGQEKDQWQTFFSIESGNDLDILRHTVFCPSYGNHEVGEIFKHTYFDEYFNSGATNKFWYAFEYGNSYFIVINTEAALVGEQGIFIDEELAAARSNPDIDFIFVFFHKPGVTTCTSHKPHLAVLTSLMDQLEDANVDAVFTGHNHLYEHGIVNGVHHIVCGGGGAGLSGYINPYSPDGWEVVQRYNEDYSYCYVHVWPESFPDPAYYTVECKAVFDSETVEPMDSYTAEEDDGGFPGPTPQDLLDRASEISCGSFITQILGLRVKDVGAYALDLESQVVGASASRTLHIAMNGLLYGFPALFILGLRRKYKRGS